MCLYEEEIETQIHEFRYKKYQVRTKWKDGYNICKLRREGSQETKPFVPLSLDF